MIKTAILGQGYWGTKLSHTLQNIPNCSVTQSIDVKLGNDIDEIATDTEAVIIATPPQTHLELIQKALDKNLHVFVEKPICQNSAEVEQLQPLADKVLMTGHILLYNKCTEHIKDTVDFTKVKRINIVRNNWGRYQKHTVTPTLSFAPHDVALLDYWLDGLKINPTTKHRQQIVNQNVPDITDILFEHEQISISIRYTWLSIPKIRTVDIFSPTQICHWDDVTHTVSTNENYINDNIFDYNPKQTVKTFKHDPLHNEMTHFFDCIINGTSCKTGFDHAKKITQMVDILND